MKKKLALILTSVVLAATLLSGCNAVTRSYGGTQTIKLEQGQKLEMVTWKEDSLWILTREMRADEKAEKYTFKEDSNWGVLEGTVNIIESK